MLMSTVNIWIHTPYRDLLTTVMGTLESTFRSAIQYYAMIFVMKLTDKVRNYIFIYLCMYIYVYSKTCYVGAPVWMSKLHFLISKLYFKIEMNL